MVAWCSIAYGLSAPGQTTGVSVFIDPLIGNLDLTRPEVSTAYLIGTLTSATLMPTVGRHLDRLGSRTSLLLVGASFGVVLVMMSGLRGFVTLSIGFVAIRLLGQGALSLVTTTAVAPWFTRRRGLAIGITSAVGSSMIALIPIGSAAVIRTLGWRSTWQVLGLVVAAATIPMALLAIIDRPALIGQHPDGDGDDEPGGTAGSDRPSTPRSVTRREAIHTPVFWVIAAAVATSSALSTALNFHQIDLLGEQGLPPLEAAANFVPQTVGVLLATLLAGALVDHIHERWLLLVAMLLLGSAMLLLPHVRPGWVALSYGLLLGSAGAVARTAEAAMTPRLFGLANLGAIRGVLRSLAVAASAVGPVTLAVGRDATGSYSGALTLMLAVPSAVAVATVFVPVRRASDGER